MKKQNLTITCTNCKTEFDLDSALVNQFQQSIKADLQLELSRRESELNEQKSLHAELERQFLQDKSDFDQMVSVAVKDQLKTREENLKESIRKEIQKEKEDQLAALEEELGRKSKQLIELNKTKASLARLTREFEERETAIHLKMEEELNKRLESMKTSVKEEMQMESFLKIKEKENIIQSLKGKLEDAQKRILQGSTQMQGEAQELVLEEMLRETHSTDVIEEIKKGQLGADCLQLVITQSGKTAGRILYESKNTKNWSDAFIKKLKQDNLDSKADIMVIVTKTLPKGFEGRYGLIDGVWVTTLQNARDLSLLLRYGLLKTYSVMVSQTGKQDKMSLLYDYLTSEEFKNTFESILSGFKELQDSHLDEQRKLQLLWKRREKHLSQVLSSTIDFYGSIKGISGAIQDIPMLQMPKAS